MRSAVGGGCNTNDLSLYPVPLICNRLTNLKGFRNRKSNDLFEVASISRTEIESNQLPWKPSSKHLPSKPAQVRHHLQYGPDGYPEQDTDLDHDHGQGQPHVHEWVRPSDGRPLTAGNREPGRPPQPGDPGIPTPPTP